MIRNVRTSGGGQILLHPGVDLTVFAPLPLHSIGVFLFNLLPFGSQLPQSSQLGGRQAESAGGGRRWRAVLKEEDVFPLREASAQGGGVGSCGALGGLGDLRSCFRRHQTSPAQ